MKIIHCADLHLDSRINTHLTEEQATTRKAEILHTFSQMVEYAEENGVSAILIAGDLFDTGKVSAIAANTVSHEISTHPGIRFYYLRGNHDQENIFADQRDELTNLRMFGPEWTYYEEADGRIRISGLELGADNAGMTANPPVMENGCFHIVMLHGQETEGRAGDRAEVIPMKTLRGKGIDYLALGHIHGYKREQLDSRGIYCYPGCLEGRGFDECGEHGFVLLDIDEESGRMTDSFIPFAKRRLYRIEADVTGCGSTAEMLKKIECTLEKAECTAESLVKVVLTGEIEVDTEKDSGYLEVWLKTRFFFAKLEDETALSMNLKDYLTDCSLKGEFVRQVLGDKAISTEDQKLVIRYGLQAISGEEVR